MSNLILPTHVAKAVQKKKKEEEKKESAKLPEPTGWRILVLPHKGKGKTKGGVYLSDKTIQETQIATNVGLVLKVGPDAYNDTDRFPNGAWCQEKDWVVFARYAGSRLNIEGGELRILNDDEILGTVEDPESILSPVTH
jgi:co-chaperonin GroES (HSP10)|tara:strand:+ start:3711 stop:4127 length:417 start_codon:yes stop_codon:yes gene_type:complete